LELQTITKKGAPAANMSDKEALVKERVVKNKEKNHYTNS